MHGNLMKNNLENYLSTMLIENNFDVSSTIQKKLLHYLDLLQRWNKVFNLTAIRDANEMVILHILDSLSVNSFLHGDRILDVGTGAGLPGIPLALINPDKYFVLLDSNNKKTRFLTQVKGELGLENVEVVQARCEDFKIPPSPPFSKGGVETASFSGGGVGTASFSKERDDPASSPNFFTTIISRAFSSIAVMLANTQHLIAEDGHFVAMKGVYPEEEIQHIPTEFKLLEVKKIHIKGLSAERHVVCIKKGIEDKP